MEIVIFFMFVCLWMATLVFDVLSSCIILVICYGLMWTTASQRGEWVDFWGSTKDLRRQNQQLGTQNKTEQGLGTPVLWNRKPHVLNVGYSVVGQRGQHRSWPDLFQQISLATRLHSVGTRYIIGFYSSKCFGFTALGDDIREAVRPFLL